MSRTGTIFASNKRMASWLHLPQHVLTSRKLLYFHLVFPHDVPKVMDAYAAAANSCFGSTTLGGDNAFSFFEDGVSAGANVTHDFVIDRRTWLTEGRTTSSSSPLNYSAACAPQEVFSDDQPARISFRGHVTIQPILDPTGGPQIPHFFAIYVVKTT